MRALSCAALAALAVAGCFTPSAPSGAYSCSADNACPTGLSCECGMCVSGKSAAACFFDVDFDAPACADSAADGCVHEGEQLNVKLTTRDADHNPSTYSGTATIGSTWGRVHVVDPSGTFTFKNGQATVAAWLDRATPPNGSAILTAQVGTASGSSLRSLIVDPPKFTVESKPVLDTNSVVWAKSFIGFPAVEHTKAGYSIYFNGITLGGGNQALIGLATSPDGNAPWTVASSPVLTPPQMMDHYFAPSLLRLSDGDLRLFFSRVQSSMTNGTLMVARANDGGMGKAFDTPVEVPAHCPYCKDGVVYPWFLVEPGSGDWLMYFTSASNTPSVTSAIQVGRTADQGATWTFAPVPTPSSGTFGLNFDLAGLTRIVYDPTAGIYRMWFARVTDLVNLCKMVIDYGTSVDGIFYTGARRIPGQNPITPADVPYATDADGVTPGSIELPSKPGDPYTIWFSPEKSNLLLNGCYPSAVGRATRP
jgi:hypothetical protein